VVLHSGEKIAVDGKIIKGEALINETPINGRSELVAKNAGDKVFAGTFVRQGVILVKAQQVGNRTTLLVSLPWWKIPVALTIKTAEVGICMPKEADLTREAAQVVLLKEDLSALVETRRIACQAIHTIQNCFWTSVGANSLFLLLAGMGALPPLTAAILHNANTVGILGYAALSGLDPFESQRDCVHLGLPSSLSLSQLQEFPIEQACSNKARPLA
jgi:cation transport ATPase